MSRSYKVVVIGGGPGGYVAGIRLGQLGVKAAVIEKEAVGGVCLNWGCVPSKALIHVAQTVHHVSEAEAFGIKVEGVSVDVDKTRAWKNEIVGKLTGGVRQLLKGNRCEVIKGEARFTSNRTLELLVDGEPEEIGFEKCIIATGAKAVEIPGVTVDGTLIWGPRQAVDLPSIPERLLVIGGGIIGLELGSVYAKLGSKLTVVEMMDGLLTGIDRDLVRVVERRLKKLGVRVLTKSKVLGIEQMGESLKARVDVSGTEETVECDRVLVATGFRPTDGGVDLEAAGVATDKRGAIVVDETLQTNVPGIYAVGDVTGPPYLAHRAFKMGEIAAEHAAGHKVIYDVRAMPAAIFTDPEIALTGMTEDEAKAAGNEVRTGKFMLAANGRALGSGEPHGFVKTLIDAKSGKLLGAGIVGSSASEILAELTLGIEMGAAAEDLGLTVHPHPTLSEAVQESALSSIGRAIHAMNPKPR